MAKKDRSLFPPLPEPLPVPVPDNHTHVGLDRTEVQNTNEQGEPRYPLLLDNHVEMMRGAGISHAITVGCEIPDLAEVIEVARRYPEFSAAIAIHPNEAAMHAGSGDIAPDGLDKDRKEHHALSLDEAIEVVADLAADPHVVAIGETGLDYFRTGEDGKDAQKASFRAHIALAKELGLPMQIHDREAHADTVEILLAEGAPEKTVFHCFSGDAELANICAEHGWFASFAGPVSFPANEDLREALRVMPAELILLETDAPYLTAAPYRGRPNAPYLANITVRSMAQTRDTDLAELCQQIADNTETVYGIR